MRILAHFKDHKWLNRSDLEHLAAGSALRTTKSIASLLTCSDPRRLIAGRLEGKRWKAGRRLYKNVQF